MFRIGIIGASGYTGFELIRLLANHPKAVLSLITANRYVGKKVAELNPAFYGSTEIIFEKFDLAQMKDRADLVFVALPHGKSMEVVPGLLDGAMKVIDLSGDFRFTDQKVYESWYKVEHAAPFLLGRAVYGLSELMRERILESSFVANPGCFPTAAILALAPALKEGLIDPDDIIIDSLTGTSGAGRMVNQELHFSEIDNSLNSYKVGGVHQHIPEIELNLTKLAGSKVNISFTPHLAPFSRGIYSTIYAKLKTDIDLSEAILVYQDFYANDYFVKVLGSGLYPELKSVLGSNFCQLGLAVDQRSSRLIIISAIDNLVKGASGQAIQNMNLMLGLEEEEGLTGLGLRP